MSPTPIPTSAYDVDARPRIDDGGPTNAKLRPELPRERGQVDLAIQRLQEERQQLDQALAQLHKRLTPVLREMDGAKGETGAATVETLVAVAMCIEQEARYLAEMRRLVDLILSRLEL